jgi:ribosomal protein S18 acetylase RimI-like enzyme
MFDIQRLGPDDLGLILDLQTRVVSSLADKNLFQPSTPEFISYCLADGGRCYGVLHGSETVAYRMVYFPRDREFNLAKDSALPAAEHHHVGHWDTIAVLPQWRGNGLARILNARALADLAQTDIRHLFATSSPHNPHGVRTLLETGFRQVKLVRKFGGKLRFLFYRPHPEEWPPTPDRAEERLVAPSAIDDLEQAFREGWTGVGITVDGPNTVHFRMTRQPLPFSERQF